MAVEQHETFVEQRPPTAGRHPNIVGLRNLVLEKGSLYFVFEFLAHDLHRLICSQPAPFDSDTISRMARDLFSGLAHLHARGFLHRDLKPENVLCDQHGSVLKLGDLGLYAANPAMLDR